MSTIHPTAIIHEKATIGKDCYIGPYSCIGEHVVLGDGCRLESHVVIEGHTTLGNKNHIFPFASIGHIPQDLKFRGEKSRTIIGNNNNIREYVTIQPGTEDDRMETRIGDNCLLMVGSHVAHDCTLGNRVILANNATLAGHVDVGDYVIIGGLSAVHQFVRLGEHAMIGGMSGVEKDVVPFGLVMGDRAHLNGLNLVGLRRRGFNKADIQKLRDIFDDIFTSNANEPFNNRLKNIIEAEKEGAPDIVSDFLDFMQNESKRSYCLPRG